MITFCLLFLAGIAALAIAIAHLGAAMDEINDVCNQLQGER